MKCLGGLVCLLAIACAGCAQHSTNVGFPAPDPSDCYVIVHDEPGFLGVGDVLNGPARWSALDGIPYRPSWHNRIRSLEVGTAATAVAYTDKNFTGSSRHFAPGTKQSTLDVSLSGQIESLAMTCRQDPERAAHNLVPSRSGRSDDPHRTGRHALPRIARGCGSPALERGDDRRTRDGQGRCVEIAMELLFSRPLIRGAVNGTEPVAMLIDPELDTTRLTPALRSASGYPPRAIVIRVRGPRSS